MDSCRTLKDIAAVKFAVEICNDFDMKKEILCASGSEYCFKENLNSDFDRKEHWSEILEKKTFGKLKQQRIPECIKENITGLVLLIAMKMLYWAKYHEGMFGLSRERSVDFLNSSFFTSRGIIDNKKVASELMNEESLNIEQKYRLACIYCFTDQLPILFKQIPRERKKAFYNEDDPAQVNQPTLIKFWSYYLMGEIDLLKGEKSLDRYRLANAVKSGSLAAVEYCFKFPNIREEKNIVLSAARLAVRSILRGEESKMYVFKLEKYDFESRVWTPKDYYTEIILFLLSKMIDIEKIYFLREEIWCYVGWVEEDSNVLQYFLDWPYQSYFRESEKLVREVLPRERFTILLLKICDKIENGKNQLNYGEEKCVDYRNFLQEWLKSFGFIKCILQDNEIYENGFKLRLKEVKDILHKLFTLKHFTYRDHENILLILNFTTYDERKIILSSDEGKSMCFGLMRKERWRTLDEFLLKCFFCKDEKEKFKKDLIVTEEAKSIVRDFVENNKLDAIQFFIHWISLSEEELVQYKEEIIFSWKGQVVFMMLVFENGNNEGSNKILKSLLSSEKTQEFKKTLLSKSSFYYYYDDVKNGSCQRIENFFQWVTSPADEIKKFKYDFIYNNIDNFKDVLFRCRESYSYEVGQHVNKIYYDCGDWINAEKLLTWCLSTEKEILEFKKNLLERFGVKIHFQLIRANQWVEAETFFAWLGLTIRGIQKLKKNTIFKNIRTILKILKDTEDYSTYDFVDYEFSTYGGLQDRIELLLRWCLCDRKSVLEFKNFLEKLYARPTDSNILNYFSLAIEEYLTDLKTDSTEIYNDLSLAIERYLSDYSDTDLKAKRRKLAVLSPSKKLTKKFRF